VVPYATQRMTTHIPEDQLVARCRSGDLDAFGQVYAQYERPVFRYAYHLLANAEDADDVKQETFLKAYRAMASFKGDSRLLTWLLVICGNLCRDQVKRRKRQREVLYDPRDVPVDTYGSGSDGDPDAKIEKDERSRVVLGALQGMPPDQREIIVLREIEELDYAEIAKVLGCSLASVKLKLFRARRRFKERVEFMLQAGE
jgi:RNA polymerase sigma-70 factor, ECF subfamily